MDFKKMLNASLFPLPAFTDEGAGVWRGYVSAQLHKARLWVLNQVIASFHIKEKKIRLTLSFSCK